MKLNDGSELFHLEVGSGLPCLVMHGGLGVDHTQFREALDPLGDVLRLVYYDHRGNGRSGRPPIATLTLEQFAADEKAVADARPWLKEQDVCQVTLWNNSPLIVSPPNFVELEIVRTDPGMRGDTASGGGKPAELSTGAVVRVPLFVEEGEVIRVDTRSGEYVGRVK